MTHVSPAPAAAAPPARLDPEVLEIFAPDVRRLRASAGPDLTLIVGGSHATGDAVWAVVDGRRLLLSDLDIYAVLPSPRARDAARARTGDGLEAGRGTPRLDAGFFTPDDLARQPARPGILDLRRHGIVLDGDPAILERVPAWTPRDVGGEEIALLLENRAFELLVAWELLVPGGAASRLAPTIALHALHLVHKVALDVAGVECLEAGEYPDGTRARVERARALRRDRGPEPAWDEALAFRARPAPAAPGDAARIWARAAGAWEAAWRRHAAGVGEQESPVAAALRAARRAPLRRRLRQGLWFRPRGGGGPALGERLGSWARGTPQHRLNAAAALLVMQHRRALEPGAGPALGDATGRALSALGIDVGAGAPERRVLALWDRWILGGTRFGDPR